MTERRAELKALVRRTKRALTEQLGQEVATLNVPGGQLNREDIPRKADEFIGRVSHYTKHIEEFCLAASGDCWVPGVRASLEIAGCLLSVEEHARGGLRFAVGLPGYLAWRLILVVGAKAVEAEEFDCVNTILGEPIEIERIGGQVSHQTFLERRMLFHPEVFLGHGDMAVRHVSEYWERHLEESFGDRATFRENLVVFLAVVALAHAGRDIDDGFGRALYPGYRLIDGYHQTIETFKVRLMNLPDVRVQVAKAFGEDRDTFERKWPTRAAGANAAKLGEMYFSVDADAFPTELTPIQSEN